MVKIRELTHPQLVEQIEKYQKIIDELFKERKRRLSSGVDASALQTKVEKVQPAAPILTPAPKAQSAVVDQADDAFALSFDDDELEKFEQEAKKTGQKVEATEKFRVTQLLTLSKDQLAELQKNAARVREAEKAKKPAKK
jgi:hypothetical protein